MYIDVYGESSTPDDSSGEDIIPYIEVDNQPGLTYGDTRLNIGDSVSVGVVVIVGECRVW